jgi:hypothetical protein
MSIKSVIIETEVDEIELRIDTLNTGTTWLEFLDTQTGKTIHMHGVKTDDILTAIMGTRKPKMQAGNE